MKFNLSMEEVAALVAENTALSLRVRQWEDEGRNFIEKVESGAARSVKTYGRFKELLAERTEVGGPSSEH